MVCFWAASLTMAGQPGGGHILPLVWVDLGWPLELLCSRHPGIKALASRASSLPSATFVLPIFTINSVLPRSQYHIEGFLKRPTHVQTLPGNQVEARLLNFLSLAFLNYEKCACTCNTIVLVVH